MSNAVKQKILLVDDEEHLLVTLRDFLTFEGYEVHLAKSGEEALNRLESVSPELIILDISMPGIGGMGFLRRVSGDGKALKCPVLVLTARSNLNDFFKQMDVAGFLSKPCRKDELLRKIKSVLASHARAQESIHRRRQKHVMLGEDDTKVSDILRQRFETAGHRVTVLESGPEVLERAPMEKPDVVVIKGVLTKMNGDAVASLLKAMPSTSAIPVVLYDPLHSDHGSGAAPSVADRFLRTDQGGELLAAIDEVTGMAPGTAQH